MISILMACYNGEKYIAEQIDSLLLQTVQDFTLYICDDASTDGTNAVISQYATDYPEKIIISRNEKNSGGAKFSFIRMMIEHRDDYIMLCDHDDVWLPDKIELTLAKMREMEAEHSAQTPILIHTDLRVVNANLETISQSFKEAMNSNFSKTKLRNLVIQNTLTGCTAMYNRALAEYVTEVPPYMVMHDWWLMLIAAAFGKIASLDEQTILYRQHGNNEIGAKDVRTLRYKVNKLLHSKEIKDALNGTYLQAQSLLDTFGDRLTQGQKEFLAAYCDIPNHNKLVKWASIFRLGVLKNGVYRKIAEFIYV